MCRNQNKHWIFCSRVFVPVELLGETLNRIHLIFFPQVEKLFQGIFAHNNFTTSNSGLNYRFEQSFILCLYLCSFLFSPFLPGFLLSSQHLTLINTCKLWLEPIRCYPCLARQWRHFLLASQNFIAVSSKQSDMEGVSAFMWGRMKGWKFKKDTKPCMNSVSLNRAVDQKHFDIIQLLFYSIPMFIHRPLC